MRAAPARPFGQEMSMLDVRRADPGTRTGDAPADNRGGIVATAPAVGGIAVACGSLIGVSSVIAVFY
jgi:hypothetical protein